MAVAAQAADKCPRMIDNPRRASELLAGLRAREVRRLRGRAQIDPRHSASYDEIAPEFGAVSG